MQVTVAITSPTESDIKRLSKIQLEQSKPRPTPQAQIDKDLAHTFKWQADIIEK
jgi:hypothetical protein